MPKKLITVLMLLFTLVAIQFVRPSQTNPQADPRVHVSATLSVPPNVAGVFSRSCNDCHSNETVWPWYSKVAPVSWLVSYDVASGRKELNLSEWGSRNPAKDREMLNEICKEVTEGEMPGWVYTLMHSEAKLAKSDVAAICDWTRTVSARTAGQNESTSSASGQ